MKFVDAVEDRRLAKVERRANKQCSAFPLSKFPFYSSELFQPKRKGSLRQKASFSVPSFQSHCWIKTFAWWDGKATKYTPFLVAACNRNGPFGQMHGNFRSNRLEQKSEGYLFTCFDNSENCRCICAFRFYLEL